MIKPYILPGAGRDFFDMRILQILPEMNVGGVETGTLDFARYLTKHGHHHIVVSNGGRMVKELEKIGVRHYALPVHKKSPFTMAACVRPLRELILKEKIQIVHARSRIPAWIAYFACRATQAALVTTAHGYYGRHLFSRVMGWPKLVIVPSIGLGRYMIDTFHVPVEKIRCVPRGVDLKHFQKKTGDKTGKSQHVIASIGRLTPLKGHDVFIKAMAKVVRSMPYVKIWIIGDAPAKKEAYRHELEMLVKQNGLSDHVEFLGSRQDVPALLREIDVLVLSSVKPESFGRVITEAQAAGVPVVATNIGGFAEILDHERTGLLVLPRDTEAMAQAVRRVLNDRKFARQMVEAAREKLVTEFTVEKMAERTLAVYDELLRSLRILVIKMSSLGDVILVVPSLKALRHKYPKAQISCLVGRESRQLLQRCPYVDEVIVIEPKNREKGLWALLRFSKKLRGYAFDKVVDFQNNLKSHLLAFLSLPKESYGFKNRKAGWLLSHPVPLPKEDLLPVEHQFKILKELGIEYPKNVRLELWPSARDIRRADELLAAEWVSEKMTMVGLHVKASAKWATKNWPLEHATRLCDLLAVDHIRVILTGSEADRGAAQQLRRMVKTPPIDLVGKTDIMELAAVIKKCDVFITPDSAPMHMAAALKTPFIALFGPTASARHLPPAERYLVYEKKPSCAPCYSPRCKILSHVCMTSVTPEEIADGVRKLVRSET